jgi:hypothetical protein
VLEHQRLYNQRRLVALAYDGPFGPSYSLHYIFTCTKLMMNDDDDDDDDDDADGIMCKLSCLQ